MTQSKWQEEDRSSITEQSAYFLRQACARSLFKRGINPGYITNPELNQQWSVIENDRYKLGCVIQASAPADDDGVHKISLLQNHLQLPGALFCFLTDTCAFNH